MNQKTPLFKPFFTLSILTLIVFVLFYWQARNRNLQLKQGYDILESQGIKSFATIKEYHASERKGLKSHIYTYSTSDENGRLMDIVEYVDIQTHKKLRIGDTILVTKKSIYLLGNQNLIARIQGNTYPPSDNIFLEKFAISGIIVSIFTLVIAITLFGFEKRK